MNGHGVSQSYYDEQVARNAALKDELERLRAELAATEAKRVKTSEQWALAMETLGAKEADLLLLRAELAVAKALLREVLPWLGGWAESQTLYMRIRAALSDQPTPTNPGDKP